MADHLGRGDAAHLARDLKALPGGDAIQEPGRELIARPGRIDRHHPGHRHFHPVFAADHHHIGARAGADDKPAFGRRLLQRALQIGLVERGPFVFIAQREIHLVLHQTAEAVAVAIDAERVGQRDPRPATAAVAALRRLQEPGLAVILVEKIALKEQDFGVLDDLERHVLGRKLRRNPQIGVHRALAIGRDEDHRARRGQIGRLHRRVREIRALGIQRGLVEMAQGVIGDAADESRRQAKVAQPRDGVADRAAGRLGALGHRGIKLFGAVAVDQLHDALFDAHRGQEFIVALRDHIDDGVADADNLVFLHAVFSS